MNYMENNKMHNWINVNDKLPEDGQWVFVHLNINNWGSIPEVYYQTAQFRRGISLEDRNKMKSGEIEDKDYTSYEGYKSKRSNIHMSADEGMNNEKPYVWQEHGPMCHFGQDVDYWMFIPKLKKG